MAKGRTAIPEEIKRARADRLRALFAKLRWNRDGVVERLAAVGERVEPNYVSKWTNGHDAATGETSKRRLAKLLRASPEDVERFRDGEIPLEEMFDRVRSAWESSNLGGGLADVASVGAALIPSIESIRRRFPELARCLEYHRKEEPDRWSGATIAAAAAGLWPDDTSAMRWRDRLDRLDKVLRHAASPDGAPPIPSPPPPKKTVS
jgi:hypothetical protein